MDGQTLLFLGSSVTYGSGANGRSFVELLDEKYSCTCIKLAVSGTTLVDENPSSYVSRLTSESRSIAKVDHLLVQLSTNDATGCKPLGVLNTGKNPSEFDTKTVIGAIEYIIAFAKETWNCKVSFYTGTYYESAAYEAMVKALLNIQKKWDIGVLDLYNDPAMRAVSKEEYATYMVDPIHPSAFGYKQWWLPKFEEFFLS